MPERFRTNITFVNITCSGSRVYSHVYFQRVLEFERSFTNVTLERLIAVQSGFSSVVLLDMHVHWMF